MVDRSVASISDMDEMDRNACNLCYNLRFPSVNIARNGMSACDEIATHIYNTQSS